MCRDISALPSCYLCGLATFGGQVRILGPTLPLPGGLSAHVACALIGAPWGALQEKHASDLMALYARLWGDARGIQHPGMLSPVTFGAPRGLIGALREYLMLL